MSLTECSHLWSSRIAVCFGPYWPPPDRTVCGPEMFLKRLEQRLLAKSFAMLGLKSTKSTRTIGILRQMGGAEMPVQAGEDFRFRLRNSLIIHLFRSAKRA